MATTKLPPCPWCGAQLSILKTSWKRDARWVCYGCRILKKCHVTPHPNGCWIWLGTKKGKYGVIGYNKGRRWKLRHAHRLAYAIWIDPVPKSWAVVHVCEEKLCCNPKHLKLVQQPESLAISGEPGELSV